MVDMNPDHIIVVPDTPDRIQQSTGHVSSSAATRDTARIPGDPSPKRILKFKIKTNSNQGQSSTGSAISEPRAVLTTSDIFKQAESARLLPEAKMSPPKLDRATGKSVVNGYGARTLSLNQSSSIPNRMLSMDAGVRASSCQIREGQVSHRDAIRRNVEFRGVGSGLPTISAGKPQNGTKSSTSNALKEVVGADVSSGSSPSEDKCKAVNTKGTAGLPSCSPSDVPQRYVGQRKLVRNGCISPSNIVERSVKADEKQGMCSTSGVIHRPNPHADFVHEGNIIDLTDNSPTVTRKGSTVTDGLIYVNNMATLPSEKVRIPRAVGTLNPQGANQASSSSCSEGFSNKGKQIIHDLKSTERSGEGNTMRVRRRAVVDSSDLNGDTTDISSRQGWRTTHNQTSKLSRSLLGTTATSCGTESGSSGPSNLGQETAAGGSNNSFSAATRSISLRNRTIGIGNGKRKHTLSSYHPGEGSSSLNEHSGSCVASSDTTAGRNRTILSHDTPVIDIDDISSPEVRPRLGGYRDGTSIGPYMSAQLEADEILARQLQEQLYNETPRVAPSEEIDAIVAMSLQHEEDAGRTSRTVRRSQNDTRAARAYRSSAAQHAIRARYEYETALSHIRDAAPITLGLRAIVAGYPASRIQPNIDLNDYDALLALDENNHQHTGASESQINNLPQSVFQPTSIEEPCAVCLENPDVGDTIRTLPCFHKFHKECIDEWLRRKKLCPVCKCGITS